MRDPLEVPETAYFAAQRANKYEWSREAINAAAPLIVAAAYRRLAKKYMQQARNTPADQKFLQDCAGMLLDEADELER
jgi:hypothetical protein